MLEWIEETVLHAAAQWWMLPLTLALCLLDGIVPVFPSESVIVALAAIVRDGQPFSLWALWAVGFAGAFLGDILAYAIGRAVGVDRFRWMRTPRVRASVAVARHHLNGHGALLLFTGRFIPGGRVAINLTAGAIRYPLHRFVALDLLATAAWSAYSIMIARLTTGWLDNALLQIAVSVTGAALVGVLLDRALKAVLRRRLGTGVKGLRQAEDEALR